MSTSTIVFSYAIGLIFAIGGVAFLIGLDDNRFLFGIPYLLIGLVIIGGVVGAQRREFRKHQQEMERRETGPQGRSPY